MDPVDTVGPAPPLLVPINPVRRQPGAVVAFAAFSILVLFATWRVLAPFITSILMAAIVVTFTYSWYARLTVKLKGRSTLAAALMLLMITLVIVLPAFVLTMMLIQQATHLFEILQKTDVDAFVKSAALGQRLQWIQRIVPGFDPSAIQPERVLINIAKSAPSHVAAFGGRFLGGLASGIIGFIMMLLAAFYFYIDGARLVRELAFLSPLPDKYDDEIFRKFRGVVDATFRGQMLTALAQGAVTAIGLAIAGIPGPIFWGTVAALFSLIPMVGAATIWAPAAAYLFLAAGLGPAGYGKAIFLTLWGVFVVSLVDNLVRPWAMKSGTEMPAVVLFFAILGGIQAFGFVGLILGPLVFAFLVTVVHIYKSFFKISLQEQNQRPEVPASALVTP